MKIKKATMGDIDKILEIYENARAYMRLHGNKEQWINGYPDKSVVQRDIEQNNCHICVEDGEIIGVFCFFIGDDPTYGKIYQGNWLNSDPYGVIHRIAVAAHRKGVASACYDYALKQCPNIKIDTHKDNYPMQNSLKKNGFKYCGIIYLADGNERLAFQKNC